MTNILTDLISNDQHFNRLDFEWPTF